jgi:hypothetical protein
MLRFHGLLLGGQHPKGRRPSIKYLPQEEAGFPPMADLKWPFPETSAENWNRTLKTPYYFYTRCIRCLSIGLEKILNYGKQSTREGSGAYLWKNKTLKAF